MNPNERHLQASQLFQSIDWPNYDYSQAEGADMDFPDFAPGPHSRQVWISKHYNQTTHMQARHVIDLNDIPLGSERRLHALYGVPVEWTGGEEAEYLERIATIDKAKAAGPERHQQWLSYYGMVNEEHFEWMRERVVGKPQVGADASKSVILYELCTEAGALSSPYCWKVREALLMLSIRIDSRIVLFQDIQAHFAGAQKTLPVLTDGDKDIGGSWAIVEHLSKHHDPDNVLFGDKGGYRLAAYVNHWVDASVYPAMNRMLVQDIYASCHTQDQAYFRAKEEARQGASLAEVQARREADLPAFQTLLHPARRAIKESAFIGGDRPTYADMALHSAFQWARAVSSFNFLREDDRLNDWIRQMDAWLESVTPATIP